MRYFFHTNTTTRYSGDEGLELDTPLEAREEAIRLVGELMRISPSEFWGSRPWGVTVTDAAGLTLWEIAVEGTAAAAAPQ